MKISNQVKPQVADISKLDSSKLSADNLLLLSFLQKDSQLTNDIKKNIYSKLVVTQEKQMVEMFTTYNAFLKKTPEDQEKEKGIFNKTIAAVENDRDKITSKETPTEDKVKTGLKYAGIAVGGRLAIRAIRRGWNSLFGSKDKKESSEGSSSSRWKRALGIGGGALVLWLLGKRDDSKKENGEVDP